ncbi:MAG: HD domain-containing phosphohydrolase [Opitutales bacterium]
MSHSPNVPPLHPADPQQPGRILLVDDDPAVLEILQLALRRSHHEVSSHLSTASARRYLDENEGWVDIVLSDLNMPQEDGVSLLQDVLGKNDTVVGIMLTGHATTQSAVRAMRAGAFDFITKPVDFETLDVAIRRGLRHRQLLLENRNYSLHMEALVQERSAALENALTQLACAYQFTLESLVSLLEAREKATGEHSKRVTQISVIIAQALNIEGDELQTIRNGAFLHDIGKVGVPDAILQKTGPLDAAEWEVMKRHVEIGYSILSNNPDFERVAELVYSHHERYDGKGYPRGLKGTDIYFGARIFAVADTYDAMRSTRPYSASSSPEKILEEITRCRNTQFDPVVVDILPVCQGEIEALWRAPQSNLPPREEGNSSISTFPDQ